MNQFDLTKFRKNPDGTYSRISVAVQPRNNAMGKSLPAILEEQSYNSKEATRDQKIYLVTGTSKVEFEDVNAKGGFRVKWPGYRMIKLTLFGEPMPKQSVRGYATGRKNKSGNLIVDHFQPQKTVDRTKDYIRQIIDQLPKDFTMFETMVHVKKMHFVFAPLKGFHKIKGRMEALRNGEIFWKNTKPDMPDNLKKLVNDSMSGLVFKDDSIIVSEDNIKKYYGTGGCIVIELEGY